MNDEIRELITEVVYNDYCQAVGGIAFNGDPLPDWEEFQSDPNKVKQSSAWRQSVSKGLETYKEYLKGNHEEA